MKSPLKIIAFLSGRGSNFKSIVEYAKNEKKAAYEIIAVFSDKPGAPGLYYAKDAGIPVHAFFRSESKSFDEFKKRIFDAADEVKFDLVALCGYMQIVPSWFIRKHDGAIINIHPSLLPKHPGLHTHEKAIEAGETEHGCSVHVVDAGIDTGPVISRARVPVLTGDAPEILAARVLEREHRLYPWTLSAIANGQIEIKGGKIFATDYAKKEAAAQGFELASDE